MIVTIKRQLNENSEPYWQSFEYTGILNTTVSAVLDTINYTDDIYDIDGRSAKRICWECSCIQKMCGACAMIINGVPALACNTFLNKLKCDKLILQPLSKFPVISDLIVDRSIIEKNLRNAKIYQGEYAGANYKEYLHQYSVAKCLKCGLCLEVCPNYIKGQNFYGALFANDTYLTHNLSANRKDELKKEYNIHFARGCSKSLACQAICPVGISTLSSMLKMN